MREKTVKKERKTYTEIAEDAEITEKREAAVRKQLADMGAAVLAPIGVREREEEKPKTQVKNRYLGHPNPREETTQDVNLREEKT